MVLGIFVAGGILLYGKIKPEDSNKQVTLTYWGLWDDPTIMEAVIVDYQRTHPNVKIQYEKKDIKGLGQYVERLKSKINKGDGLDIIRFHSSWVRQLKSYLLPFPNSVVDEIDLEKDFYKTVEKDLKYKGAYYGVPLGIDTLSLFVNTQILSTKGLPIPNDWNDILSRYAPELVVKDEQGKILTPSISLGTFDNVAHAPDIIALLLIQNGADLENLTGKSSDNAYDAFTFYTGFADGSASVWDETLDNSTLAFAKGNLALYFGYSWDIFTIKALNPNLDFRVVKVPALKDRKNTVASYWAEGVSAKTKHPKEAFEFLTYLSKRETLEKLHQTQSKVRLFGTLYPRKSMAPLLSSNDLVYPFVSQADDAQTTFFSSDTHDGETGMITRLNVYMGNAIRSINNNTSVSTAVDTLSKGVTEVLSK